MTTRAFVVLATTGVASLTSDQTLSVGLVPRIHQRQARTPSGLDSKLPRMKVLRRGNGQHRPKPNDCVRLTYVARRGDGTVWARSPEDGAAETRCLSALLPAVAAGLQAMVEGEERLIWVDRAREGSSELMTYDITLVQVIAAPPTPLDLLHPTGARTFPSGLVVKTLAKGSGDRHATPASRVKVNLTGWTQAGVVFESTALAGRSAVYIVDSLVPGLQEAICHMRVGEKTRLWIPAELAYGLGRHKRGQPVGPLVYEVELVSIDPPS